MTIRKRESGKYQVIVYEGINPVTGKPKKKYLGTFKTRREAVKAENEFKYKLNNGEYVETTEKTLDEGAKIYFDTVAPYSLTEYSQLTGKKTYESRFMESLGHMVMKNIKPYQIQNLYTKWLQGTEEHKAVKPSTIRKYHTVIRQILNAFVEWGELKDNPADRVQLPKLNKPEKKIWSRKEVMTFLNVAKNYQYFIAYYLALFTGMRLGEVLGLEWKNIDFDNNAIYVRKQYSRVGNGKSQIKEYTKTDASRRSIYISDEVKKQLLHHQEQQDPHSNYVCTTSIGTLVNYSNIRRSMKVICKEADVPYISFHELRHTHASLALQIGVEPKVIQERLGHSKLSTTMDIYTHTIPKLQKDFAEDYSNFFHSAE